MKHHVRHRWTGFAVAAAVYASPLMLTAQGQRSVDTGIGESGRDVVSFCAGANNLPLSSEGGSEPGLEVEFARAIAAAASLEAAFVWLDVEHESFEDAVRDGRCRVALGVLADPGAMAERPALHGLVLTEPYYATGYLVIRRPSTRALTQLAEAGNARFALEGESVVAYTLRQRGRSVQVLFEHGDVIDAVAQDRVPYGYLWGPIAGWQLRSREDLVIDPAVAAEDQWPFALAVRSTDTALRDRLSAGIARVLHSGEGDRICRSYGIPGCAPETRGRLP